MKVALVLTVTLFIVSLSALMFSENIYGLLASTDVALAETVYDVFRTDGVMPVLQGLMIVSGVGLAIMGVSYGSSSQ